MMEDERGTQEKRVGRLCLRHHHRRHHPPVFRSLGELSQWKKKMGGIKGPSQPLRPFFTYFPPPTPPYTPPWQDSEGALSVM